MHIKEAVDDRGHGVQEGLCRDAQLGIDGEVDHGAEVRHHSPGLGEFVVYVIKEHERVTMIVCYARIRQLDEWCQVWVGHEGVPGLVIEENGLGAGMK